jgi:hypothetical protein
MLHAQSTVAPSPGEVADINRRGTDAIVKVARRPRTSGGGCYHRRGATGHAVDGFGEDEPVATAITGHAVDGFGEDEPVATAIRGRARVGSSDPGLQPIDEDIGNPAVPAAILGKACGRRPYRNRV